MVDVVPDDERKLAGRVREILSVYREAEDLINIGAYVKGSNSKIDFAISKIDDLYAFFRQGIMELSDPEESIRQLAEIIES